MLPDLEVLIASTRSQKPKLEAGELIGHLQVPAWLPPVNATLHICVSARLLLLLLLLSLCCTVVTTCDSLQVQLDTPAVMPVVRPGSPRPSSNEMLLLY